MVARLNLEMSEKNVLLREEDDKGIISFYGGIYLINNISLNILKALNDGLKMTDVMNNLLNEYEIQWSQLSEDVILFLKQLLSIGIISKDLFKNYTEEIYEFDKDKKAGF